MRDQRAWIIAFLLCFTSLPPLLNGQSLAEKKASLKKSESDLSEELDAFLVKINSETVQIHQKIQELYKEALELYTSQAAPEKYKDLLLEINTQRRYLRSLEEEWRSMAVKGNASAPYGLWHAPDTNLEQLLIDYGSQDYVYLIPPEVGEIRLSINSNLPIPRSSWSEMLELILTQNGVGTKVLNPYLRELYLFKDNSSHLELVTNNRNDLEVLPPNARIGFVLSPEFAQVRSTMARFEAFINPQTTMLKILGRDILIISQAGEVLDLLKIYDFIGTNRGEKEFRLIPAFKLPPEEMARILATVFEHTDEGDGKEGIENNRLKIVVLENVAQALFIIGTKEEVRKAEEILRNIEGQIAGARDKTLFTYVVKHSEAEELADLLYRVYSLMISTGTGYGPANGNGPSRNGDTENGDQEANLNQNRVVVVDNTTNQAPQPLLPYSAIPQKEPPLFLYGQEGYYQEGGYVVNPAPAQPGRIAPTVANNDRDNFIVDIKTGSIVMVIESDTLPKMKELIKKLDVPKKMVQIETLLFEKILRKHNSFGLNLLRIGDTASNTHFTGAAFNNLRPVGVTDLVPGNLGVFDFFLSRKKTESGIPAFDLIYRFLLNQDDIQINSCPTVMTVNQVPATISVTEDLSINTGVFEVETAKGVTLKDAFTRAQYGTTISVKPTIHLKDCETGEEKFDYVTLETDVTFDTIQPSLDPSRPNVSRRHIVNLVQVPDGETVILGGLRKKQSMDESRTIPFIGELPGLGKLFSDTSIREDTTEMFIFITPHIIKDPKDQMICLRQELLCIRPGDVPYFLECVEEAHRYEANRLMEGGMTILFGRPKEKYYLMDCCESEECGEYDGR